MGFAKREMERAQQLDSIATEIAIELGALTRCEYHEQIVDDLGGSNEDVADEMLRMFKAKDPRLALFHDESEIRDAAAGAFEDAGMDCGFCAKNAADD